MKTLPFLSILCAFLVGTSSFAFGHRPLAWVYFGPGVCDGCPESLSESLRWSGFRVKKAYPGDFTPKALRGVSIVAVPGGDEELDVKNALLPGEAETIRQYVQGGGHYLGVCLGAYLAVPRLIDSPGRSVEGLNLFQGQVFNHSPTKEARMENILWKGHHRWMYFQDGPEFLLAQPQQADIWAYYADGKIAAFQTPLGQGRVGLIGPHPEADEGWWQDDGLNDPDGIDYDLMRDFSRALIRDLP